jgi:hypothetical protein
MTEDLHDDLIKVSGSSNPQSVGSIIARAVVAGKTPKIKRARLLLLLVASPPPVASISTSHLGSMTSRETVVTPSQPCLSGPTSSKGVRWGCGTTS